MCRRVGHMGSGCVWYERAYGLAVRAGNEGEKIRAMIWFGSLLKDMGRREEAREWYKKAARAAKRKDRRRLAAEANHDLMMVCAEIGDHDAVIKHASRAVHGYPDQNPRLPYLAHDLAFALIRRRLYSPARVLLSLLRKVIVRPGEEVLLYSTVAWAAAGAGRRDEFEAAEARVLANIGVHTEHATAAFLHLAYGSRLAGDMERAASYAAQALSHARKRTDSLLEQEAEELIAEIAAGVPGPREEAPADDEAIQQLARSLAARLSNWKSPGRVRPEAEYRSSAARPEAVPATAGSVPGDRGLAGAGAAGGHGAS
jgi:tetratricopeptide (TPR) repeat protein